MGRSATKKNNKIKCANYMNPKGPNLKSKFLLEALARSVHFDASSLFFNTIVHRKSNTVTVIEVQFSKEALNLTLRLLMSYIYIYMQHLFLMFLDHTQRRSTVGRTPLDE